MTRLQVELRETKGEREEMRGRAETAEARLGQTEVSSPSLTNVTSFTILNHIKATTLKSVK